MERCNVGQISSSRNCCSILKYHCTYHGLFNNDRKQSLCQTFNMNGCINYHPLIHQFSLLQSSNLATHPTAMACKILFGQVEIANALARLTSDFRSQKKKCFKFCQKLHFFLSKNWFFLKTLIIAANSQVKQVISLLIFRVVLSESVFIICESYSFVSLQRVNELRFKYQINKTMCQFSDSSKQWKTVKCVYT